VIRRVCDYCGARGVSNEDVVERVLCTTCGEPVLEV
jgi:hypothetical protein